MINLLHKSFGLYLVLLMGCGPPAFHRSDDFESIEAKTPTTAPSLEITRSLKNDRCEPDAMTSVDLSIWTGFSRTKKIAWNKKDLLISDRSEGSLYSFWRNRAVEDFSNLKRDSTGLKCLYGRDLQVLSIVGDLISISDRLSIDCGTDSSFLNFLTFDLSTVENMPTLNSANSVRSVSLKELFSNEDLFAAISKTLEMTELIKSERFDRRPKDLAALLALISEKYSYHKAGDFALSEELENFAFVSTQQDKVVVRLFVLPTSGYNAKSYKHIDIWLPRPGGLAIQLDRAAEFKEGFLLGDQLPLFRESKSRLECSF